MIHVIVIRSCEFRKRATSNIAKILISQMRKFITIYLL